MTELDSERVCAVPQEMLQGVNCPTLTEGRREATVPVDIPWLPHFVEDQPLTAGALAEVFFVELEHLSCEGVGGVSIEVAIGSRLKSFIDVSVEVLGFENVVERLLGWCGTVGDAERDINYQA